MAKIDDLMLKSKYDKVLTGTVEDMDVQIVVVYPTAKPLLPDPEDPQSLVISGPPKIQAKVIYRAGRDYPIKRIWAIYRVLFPRMDLDIERMLFKFYSNSSRFSTIAPVECDMKIENHFYTTPDEQGRDRLEMEYSLSLNYIYRTGSDATDFKPVPPPEVVQAAMHERPIRLEQDV